MCLFKNSLFYIFCWLNNIECMANSTVKLCLNETSLTCVFSPQGILQPSCAREHSISALRLGTVSSRLNHGQKVQNAKNMALNRPWKGHINSLRVETRRQSITLSDLSWECAHRAIQISWHLAQGCKWLWKHCKYLFGSYK